MVDYIRLAIGAMFNAIVWTMLALNIFVIACILKGRLHVKEDNSVFALASFNICCDIFQLILHVCYIGPAIISGLTGLPAEDACPAANILEALSKSLAFIIGYCIHPKEPAKDESQRDFHYICALMMKLRSTVSSV
ncbi:hypothetical protein Y032_0143g2430 [Ancylostoma ceylanicum]|uniref:7TM GPCR serpentine receptor class x (Srx) domain-containing protein n=1 Tax=Ancylostoma ceylanicum TaxID=53326 RepID=A0A016T2H2_9BILA|nr:hypothetical protein Y032_0143g2430 [Ancylostoma ceylanicum]